MDCDARIKQLLSTYDEDRHSLADLLCDGRDPSSLAYRIVRPDLTSTDMSYGDLRRESEHMALVLTSLGVGQGDRVATLMGKSRHLLVTLVAIWRLGAVYVPLFTAFAPPAIALRLTGSGAKVVICDPAQERKLDAGQDIPADAPWRKVTTGEGGGDLLSLRHLMDDAKGSLVPPTIGGADPFIHIFTSGTTGRPKGVVVPKRALAGFRAYAEFGLNLMPSDTFWCSADPGWGYGLFFGILASLTTGTPSILLEGGFSAEATLAVLARYGVTNFAAAPTVYRSLRASNVPVPDGLHLRHAASAGEPLTPDVNEWAASALGVQVADHYGQTEAGMMINNHNHPSLRRPLKPGSMGHPMPGWSAVILDEALDVVVGADVTGRVAMEVEQSPLAWFGGYADAPDKSAEKFAGGGRWYLTGDTGRRDADGFFYFSSRDDDVIIMAGYRIGPFEVESVLATHPAVLESAVIATRDAIRGEVLEAFVVVRQPSGNVAGLAEELQQWVKKRYAAHAYPRAIHFVESLPKTPSGKIQRFLLRERRRSEMALAQGK